MLATARPTRAKSSTVRRSYGGTYNRVFGGQKMTEGRSLINFGDIGKPATLLIEKISNAVGGYFRPYQIKRVAKAEAEAEIVRVEAQVEVTDLQRRAVTRFIAEEAKKQENIETIAEKAIPQLSDSSNPQEMEDDWVTNFFDKCRIISDEDMQALWSRILAGEANAPGQFSKRTVNLLGSLDKADADLFTTLCGFVWRVGQQPVPLVYDRHASIYTEAGIVFDALSHLHDIGLINFEVLAGYQISELPKHVVAHYYETPIIMEFKGEENNEMDAGEVILTRAGEELTRVCGGDPVEGFPEYVLGCWMQQGLVLASAYPQNADYDGASFRPVS